METINTVELKDENIYPDNKVIKSILDESYTYYLKLLEMFKNYDFEPEWRYYRDGKAWLCKVKRKNRTIIWMSAWKGYMQVTIYFPEKYFQSVYELDICEDSKMKIRSTKNVGKSKPCIFELRNDCILNDIEKTINLKIQCK